MNALDKLIEEVSPRFVSGNSIAVERTHLKQEQWDVIFAALQPPFETDATEYCRVLDVLRPLLKEERLYLRATEWALFLSCVTEKKASK